MSRLASNLSHAGSLLVSALRRDFCDGVQILVKNVHKWRHALALIDQRPLIQVVLAAVVPVHSRRPLRSEE